MRLEYPIVFDQPIVTEAERAEDIAILNAESEASPFAYVTYDIEPRTDEEAHVWHLAKISGWPEAKTVWKVKCHLGICTKVPVLYRRSCTKFAYAKVIYPTGQMSAVNECVVGAGLAAAVAAVISGGAAASATFEAALQACLEAKGYEWARSVRVSAGWDSQCGDWHPV
ncbi:MULTISPECIES: hypothetical protein [unclassified Caulobacter]|jgi:hypothetical protein|uniref:hypothetical protein n=1 Tax=unclassified Caulobacter TaxID=2648921 RepID=UPI0006F24C24|nr:MULTISPECIES: hypothetical protein [unclassified Caulobacter]KQV58708.1 hypothetical protein ASC62_08010 [Caulobacter sp. Root342]KQV68783.1 hypothetical protein ASC70_08025 [Caulobacter sp. Root343]